MIIPRIKLDTRILAETGATPAAPVYVLVMYIAEVNGYDTETGLETGPFTQVPEELFLYRKFDNIPLTTSLDERVRAGEYIRVMEPDDIDSGNYTLFGEEALTWSSRQDARASLLSTTLMPAVSPSGTALTRSEAINARAPFFTGCRAGYYKSRVYVLTNTDIASLTAASSIMKLTLNAFIEKYIDTLSYDGAAAELYETEVISDS